MTSTRVVTGKVRLSYAHLDKPYATSEGQDPKYSVTLLIPKSDTKTLDKIAKAQAAARDHFRARNPQVSFPDHPKTTLYDGDGQRPGGDDFGPECRGCMVMTVSSKDAPVLVDRDRNDIMRATDIYSGCYGRVDMNFFAYSNSGNKGISAALLGVQKLADGDPLGGGERGSADAFNDDFEDDDDWM